MPDRRTRRSSNMRFLPWLLLYSLVVAYGSTVIGPKGINYVPMDPSDALREFTKRAFVWVNNGSDQRADWMGNLAMFVPFGFMMLGTVAPRLNRGIGASIATFVAFLLSVVFLMGVKYAQLFFPPRTVTLNYMIAQASGALIGIVLYQLAHNQLVRLLWRRAGGYRETLRSLLWLYCAALCVFLLMPLDFALSLDDLMVRVDRVPTLLFHITGEGRPRAVQAVLLFSTAVAMIPFGMRMVLARYGRNRFFEEALLRGFAWLGLLFVATALLLSGVPALISLVFRATGIVAGIWMMRTLVRQDPNRLREWLGRKALWLVLPYFLILLSVNGLVSTHWQTPQEALRNLYTLGLLPLFDYYIVTKATAAKNIVAHVVMYLPIGVFVWLRGYRSGVAGLSALLLAAAVELARYLRPGLEGDINAVALAGLSALFTARTMPGVWHLLEGVTLPTLLRPTAQVLGWRERAAAARLRESAVVAEQSHAEHV
ncbi:MAG: VanZ family protein [Rhodospirillales bacterium]